ncbi:MAG TPA: GH25 family lysozyme [Cyclobacteriaceae bacterium]|nr:GH25 family lysozyme [Cyclobacteriaceae bacterium]
MLNGIDVSSYQKFSNYELLNDTNTAFMFIKASESIRQDPMFRIHNEGIAKTKLLKGAYHFLRFSHTGEEQANAFINSVGPTLGDYDLPPVLDIEDISENIDVNATETFIKAWLDTVKAKYKVDPIIYTGAWYWKDKTRLNNSSSFAIYPLWVSAYASSYPPPFGGWSTPTFWQYSEKGTIAGLVGTNAAIDLNYFLGDINALWKMLPASKTNKYSELGPKISAVQYQLRKKVDTAIQVDGKWGDKSKAALEKWQVAKSFSPSDSFDPVQWQSLFDLLAPGAPTQLTAPAKIGQPVFPEPGVITTDKLNIRNGAGINSPMIASPLPKGKSVTILEESNGWYRVKTQIEGWVNKDFVQIQN